MADSTIPMPKSVQDAFGRVFQRANVKLFKEHYEKDMSFSALLAKSVAESIVDTSQGISAGIKEHPFDMVSVKELKQANIHHARCLNAKVACTVGLGFQTEEGQKRAKKVGKPGLRRFEESKAAKVLNPLCDISFQDVYTSTGIDFWELGNGLLEIKRRTPSRKSPITGIHFLPCTDAQVYVENEFGFRHWVIRGKDKRDERRFAMFGDIDRYMKANKKAQNVSEVIHFRQPNNVSRWYGMPDHLAVIAAIELVQCVYQDKFDSHLNRGVPEFLMFFIGTRLTKKDWDKIEKALNANIGLGNSHKSMAMELPGSKDTVDVKVEKLAMENKNGDTFSLLNEALATHIVSGHGVPPLLAGIQIPGKLGANNELPNALLAFQLLTINQAQFIFQQTLGTTLGNPRLNGGLPLRIQDFTHNQITDAMDLTALATMGGMRETVVEANAKGRDLGAGMKD